MLTVEERLRILASERSDHRVSFYYAVRNMSNVDGWSLGGPSRRSTIQPLAVSGNGDTHLRGTDGLQMSFLTVPNFVP